jgi:hypothetical protein
VSDRTAIGRPSPFANEPIALYDIVGNKLFVVCGSELDRKTKERCLFARDRDIRLSMLMKIRGLFGKLADVHWALARKIEELMFMLMLVRWMIDWLSHGVKAE